MSRRGQPRGTPRRDWGEVELTFDGQELLDLFVAWAALGLAFAVFFAGGATRFLAGDPLRLLAVSLLSAGVAFLLHELAHKVAAVRLGQPAAFRADYGMLFLAVMAALAGFLFAAPGAVYHPATTNSRDQGLIALAGPVTNLGLAALFLPLVLAPAGFVVEIAQTAVLVNLLLAGFNMLPFGPLDGKKVLNWNAAVFAAVFLPSVALGVYVLFGGF